MSAKLLYFVFSEVLHKILRVLDLSVHDSTVEELNIPVGLAYSLGIFSWVLFVKNLSKTLFPFFDS